MRFQYTIRKNSPVDEQRDRELEDYLASLQPTAWTAVTFLNSWVNYGAPQQIAQYRKKGDLVQVRGQIKGGASGTRAFTLPVGFRPPANQSYAAAGYTGATANVANIACNADGGVFPTSATTTDISFFFQFSISP